MDVNQYDCVHFDELEVYIKVLGPQLQSNLSFVNLETAKLFACQIDQWLDFKINSARKSMLQLTNPSIVKPFDPIIADTCSPSNIITNRTRDKYANEPSLDVSLSKETPNASSPLVIMGSYVKSAKHKTRISPKTLNSPKNTDIPKKRIPVTMLATSSPTTGTVGNISGLPNSDIMAARSINSSWTSQQPWTTGVAVSSESLNEAMKSQSSIDFSTISSDRSSAKAGVSNVLTHGSVITAATQSNIQSIRINHRDDSVSKLCENLASDLGANYALLVTRQIVSIARAVRALLKSCEAIINYHEQSIINFTASLVIRLPVIIKRLSEEVAQMVLAVSSWLVSVEPSLNSYFEELRTSVDEYRVSNGINSLGMKLPEDRFIRQEVDRREASSQADMAIVHEKEKAFDSLENLFAKFKASSIEAIEEEFTMLATSILSINPGSLSSLALHFVEMYLFYSSLEHFPKVDSTTNVTPTDNTVKPSSSKSGGRQKNAAPNKRFSLDIIKRCSHTSKAFNEYEQFFVWFILLGNNHIFIAHLRDLIALRLSSITRLLSQQDSISSSHKQRSSYTGSFLTDSNADDLSFTTNMVRLRSLGKLFALVMEHHRWGDLNVQISDRQSCAVQNLIRLPLAAALEEALLQGVVVLTLPWVGAALKLCYHCNADDMRAFIGVGKLLKQILLSKSFSVIDGELSSNRLFVVMEAQALVGLFKEGDIETLVPLNTVTASLLAEDVPDNRNDCFSKIFRSKYFNDLVLAPKPVSSKTFNPTSVVSPAKANSSQISGSSATALAAMSLVSPVRLRSASTTSSSSKKRINMQDKERLSPISDWMSIRKSEDSDNKVAAQRAFWQQHRSLHKVSTFVVQYLYHARVASIKDLVAAAVRNLWSLCADVRTKPVNVELDDDISDRLNMRMTELFTETIVDMTVKVNRTLVDADVGRLFRWFPTDERLAELAITLTSDEVRLQNAFLLEYYKDYLRRKFEEVLQIDSKQAASKQSMNVHKPAFEPDTTLSADYDCIWPAVNDLEGILERLGMRTLSEKRARIISTDNRLSIDISPTLHSFLTISCDKQLILAAPKILPISRNYIMHLFLDTAMWARSASRVAARLTKESPSVSASSTLCNTLRIARAVVDSALAFASTHELRAFVRIEISKLLVQTLPQLMYLAQGDLKRVSEFLHALVDSSAVSHASMSTIFTIIGRRSAGILIEAALDSPGTRINHRNSVRILLGLYFHQYHTLFGIEPTDSLLDGSWHQNKNIISQLRLKAPADVVALVFQLMLD